MRCGFYSFDSEAEQKALRFSSTLGPNETITAQFLNQLNEIHQEYPSPFAVNSGLL